ncbi:hypothetical protein BH23CHL7_BH23CHL7_15780 [soil metagenome]
MAAGNGTPDSEQATRRQFFRAFSRQTVSSAGSVLAGVEALRQGSQEALGDLLGSDPDPARLTARAFDAVVPPTAPAAAFRSPYQFGGASLDILDQRGLPETAEMITCSAPSEVASAIRRGLLSGGPVLGQVAAYTLAMVAAAAQAWPAHTVAASLRGAADTLRVARPTSRSLVVALDRLIEAASGPAGQGDGAALSRSLLDVADQIASEAALDHARLGQLAADALRPLADRAAADDRPLGVLMHGDQGPLTGGQIGGGTAVLQSLGASGQPVHAWLTDAAPLFEGQRAAWQFDHLAIPHTLVPDTAVAWLLANRRIDLVLLRAEWLLAAGDVVAPLGSLAAAREARAAGIAVAACAPLALYDAQAADASAVPIEGRMPAPSPVAAHGPRIDPAVDVVPAGLVDLLLTDEDAIMAPSVDSLRSAAAARADRLAAAAAAVEVG